MLLLIIYKRSVLISYVTHMRGISVHYMVADLIVNPQIYLFFSLFKGNPILITHDLYLFIF